MITVASGLRIMKYAAMIKVKIAAISLLEANAANAGREKQVSKTKSLFPELVIVPGEDYWSVLICACRYCLGRMTYMPSIVTEWIMENCEGRMPEKTIYVMLQDIQKQREFGERFNRNSLGDPCDVKTWEQFEEWLKEQRGSDAK